MALNANAVKREERALERTEAAQAATTRNVIAFAPASLHAPSVSVAAPSPKQ